MHTKQLMNGVMKSKKRYNANDELANSTLKQARSYRMAR